MIKNEAKLMEEKVEYVRSAIEHRATWFYLLLEEMKKRGIERLPQPQLQPFRKGLYLHRHFLCKKVPTLSLCQTIPIWRTIGVANYLYEKS